MAILELRAARGWSASQTADRFLVTPATISSWMQRLDEEDSPIYLTSRGVHLSAEGGSYLEKEIVDHPGSEVIRIAGRDFLLERGAGGDDWVMSDLPAGRELKSSEVNRVQGALSGLRFEEVFVADDAEVSGLVFDQALRIDLEDGSGYVLSHAQDGDRHFLRIRGHNEVEQVAITIDESEEELEKKAEMLSRADEIDAFNSFHGSWIYEISDFAAQKLQLQRADLVESTDS